MRSDTNGGGVRPFPDAEARLRELYEALLADIEQACKDLAVKPVCERAKAFGMRLRDEGDGFLTLEKYTKNDCGYKLLLEYANYPADVGKPFDDNFELTLSWGKSIIMSRSWHIDGEIVRLPDDWVQIDEALVLQEPKNSQTEH